MRSGRKRWRMAQKARPSFQLEVMLETWTPGYPSVTRRLHTSRARAPFTAILHRQGSYQQYFFNCISDNLYNEKIRITAVFSGVGLFFVLIFICTTEKTTIDRSQLKVAIFLISFRYVYLHKNIMMTADSVLK